VRVIVTGASGFIGRNVLLRAPRDWDVIAVHHRTELAGFIERNSLSHVRPFTCDLTDSGQVAEFAGQVGSIDACLYLAANGDPARSAEQPAWDLRLNTLAPVIFLEHVPVGHFVYVSSGAVYDGIVGPVTPQSVLAPRLPYAISKLATEHYARSFAEHRKPAGSYVNVRFFGAYGPYEAPRKITTRWMRMLMEGQREFSIRGDGNNLIDFMYVDDAVDAFLRLTKALGYSATLDVACGAPVSVNDIVQTMARVLGVDVTVRHQGHTEEYIRFRSVDETMRERFGFAPAVTFEDGIRRLHRFFVEEGQRAGQPA
jgi:UDP-glucose 4-epimerase